MHQKVPPPWTIEDANSDGRRSYSDDFFKFRYLGPAIGGRLQENLMGGGTVFARACRDPRKGREGFVDVGTTSPHHNDDRKERVWSLLFHPG
jgi:hypothetical protein